MSEHIETQDVPEVTSASCINAATSFTRNGESNAACACSENQNMSVSENEVSMTTVRDDASFKNFDNVSNHTDAANDMLHSMICKDYCLLRHR